MSDSLQELLETVQFMSDRYAEHLPPDGDWDPMAFVETEEHLGMAAFAGEFMESDDTKDHFADSVLPSTIRAIARELGGEPVRVVLLVSAWALMGESLDEIEEGVRPSQHKDRKEVLMLQGVTADEELMSMAEIVRGGPHPLLDWQMSGEDAMSQGRMIAGIRRGVWS